MRNEFIGSVDLIPLQIEDITEENEEAVPGEKDSEVDLERYKPAGAQVKIYIDFDNFFVVLYPVVFIGSDKYLLNDYTAGNRIRNNEVETFMMVLRTFLREYQIRQSRNFPTLLTLPVVYTDDVLDFLVKAVPRLVKVATIYYTNNFKKVMIKKALQVSISCNSVSIDQYLECGFTYDAGISPDELEAIMNAFKKKEEIRFYQLKNGGFIDLRAEKVVETLEFLIKFGITRKHLEKRKILIPKCEIPYATSLIGRAEAEKAVEFTGFDLKSIEKKVFDITDANLSVPKTLKAELRPYQQEGYRWMKTLFCAGFGGVLADDMGLGKTLQTISLILSIFEEKGDVKSLIVVPTSLIDNWISEFNRFAPALKCIAVTGDVDIRNQVFKRWNQYHVFISSYGLVLNDIEAYENRAFDVLVLDEAQRIKNHMSKTAKEIRKIKAGNKFALTGTPIENNLLELWAIFNWLMPPLLKGFESFKSKYISTSENMEELRERIRPFILRRMKRDVLEDLPDKTETTIKIELTDMQKKLYLAYRQEALQLLEEEDQIFNVLSKLTRLRQICCHPGMFLDDYRESTGKLDVLMERINELREEGRRVLVFSQFTTMLDIIKKELENNNIEYKMLDGRTPQKNRGNLIRDFDKGSATVFLISLKAGGTGLNLTSADTVIHCDPWWNPSVEEQASARVYRIGQKKCVQIINLIAKGTIEEKINDVKQQKRELIEKLIQPGGHLLTTLSTQELKQLLL